MFFWFVLMEFLQFIQDLVINDCSNPVNIFWTTFGWIHIAFQPFFSNLAMSALNKGNLRKEPFSGFASYENEDDLQPVQIMEVEFQTDMSPTSHCNSI
jgi:hypothetical protein